MRTCGLKSTSLPDHGTDYELVAPNADFDQSFHAIGWCLVSASAHRAFATNCLTRKKTVSCLALCMSAWRERYNQLTAQKISDENLP